MLKQLNFRSQEAMLTWFGLRDFGPKMEKRIKLMTKFL